MRAPAGVGRHVALGAILLGAVASPTAASQRTDLVVRDPVGSEIVRAPLEDGASVVLRYRNSLYGSLAEERFVLHGGELYLAELAADERAVLDEYYVTEPATQGKPGDARRWRATPRDRLALRELAIAATDLGERTLLLPGRPAVELWRYVDDARPTVTLTLEPRR